MNTPEAIYAGLTEAPDDWDSRSVLADWYEENGHADACACMRWMLAHRKRPYRSASKTFCWFNVERVTTTSDPESDLPEIVYENLSRAERSEKVFRRYPTLREADEDLFDAWAKTRAAGWDPDADPLPRIDDGSHITVTSEEVSE